MKHEGKGLFRKKSIHGGREWEVFFIKRVHTFGSGMDDQNLICALCTSKSHVHLICSLRKGMVFLPFIWSRDTCNWVHVLQRKWEIADCWGS
jgi:hypothetical protein